MKKKYIKRVEVLVIAITFFTYSYIAAYLDIKNNLFEIIFEYNWYVDPIAWMSLGLLITAIFTFFISDKIFKKWLKFTFWYFFISVIWIMISSESSGSFIEILDTKEQVSTFASIMFVIISLIMFIWLTIKEKKNK
ncbi:MAG: hypothetical protein ACKUBY_00595 [Candidatus Moraniibacteriota bacterium]|jgi:uncharacterized membrane protein